MKHLHLQHKFTDRGGREVYEIFRADDNKRLKNPLGTLRMTTAKVDGSYYAKVDWLEDELDAADQKAEQLELDLGAMPDDH